MITSRRNFIATTAALAASTAAARHAFSSPIAKPRKLVMIAGRPSHPPGCHEHNAGVQLFQKCLAIVDGLETAFVLNGYPKDDSILDDADGILCFADGGGGHPLIPEERLKKVGGLLDRGTGLFCLHFGVEVPKGPTGDVFRDWIGGCYEHEYSCNPMWVAKFDSFPEHPITNGVEPFSILDEWYFNMRFRQDMKNVTPILTAKPTDETRDGPYVYPRGPYQHIQDAKGRAEHLMWCTENENGSRGVGFTGGHFHKNFGNDQFRKLVLNALLWVTKVDVPENGVASSVSEADLAMNLDPK
ncbi:ThuA domain-containing protein [Pirellulaceae bacterium SH449]